MACNAPINISPSKSTVCGSRCDYTYNYADSSCSATVVNDHILLTSYSQKNPAKFNSISDYYVSSIKFYLKSIHTYTDSGVHANGELFIIHKSATNPNNSLIVCVPIVQSTTTSTDTPASEKLAALILELVKSPKVDFSNFYNLNDFVGKKSFYTYNASSFLDNKCSTNVDYIVFTPTDFSIPISTIVYQLLSTVIKKNSIKVVKTFSLGNEPSLYYNSGGSKLLGDDNIYIDCQPVDKSDETIEINKDYSNMNTNTDIMSYFSLNLEDLKILQAILFCIVFVVIIYIAYYSLEITGSIFSPMIHNTRFSTFKLN